jgi:hypothetical protein
MAHETIETIDDITSKSLAVTPTITNAEESMVPKSGNGFRTRSCSRARSCSREREREREREE